MYVHVGDDVMIRSSEIIAILDKQTVQDSEEMLELINRKKSELVDIANGTFKSLVITPSHMYLSPIAIATLKKKALSGVPMNG
ncbi:DUF370 domain-containing protein [Siminovitchia acidinfaciens]|uniref:DUF370 domain-containing protein n=1 Tax=Siminovitchia acidinfaciens TaxID=2321395 RepID=A0A429XTB0_9BACI|nr:extracellular matrix/biofilm biosynthesis regulator RemA family protein [Siminovitchia acidinfaciens]RST70958.1 DUF370 domain-containing protein [Siminovitchia acidinfaciens]